MSKAILIINNCTECPFIGYDVFTNQPRCIDVCSEKDSPREIYDDIDIDEERPDWCPLIPVPEQHIPNVNEIQEFSDKSDNFGAEAIVGYYTGWNACLDTLEGREI